jgi:hypothetical protein
MGIFEHYWLKMAVFIRNFVMGTIVSVTSAISSSTTTILPTLPFSTGGACAAVALTRLCKISKLALNPQLKLLPLEKGGWVGLKIVQHLRNFFATFKP